MDAKPENLDINLEFGGSLGRGFVLEPLLLNGGDWLKLKVLVDGDGSGFSLTGRIVGIHEIKRGRSDMNTPRSLITVLVFFGLGAIILFSISTTSILYNLAAAGVIGIVMSFFAFVSSRRWRS